MSAPYFAVDPAWWPTIADTLSGTWTRAAVLTDLRYLDNQVRRRKLKKLPGRPTLRVRWGWTDRQVRSLLKDTAAWVDPIHGCPANVQPVSSERPARVQEAAPKPAGSVAPVSSERPARVQPVSSECPQARMSTSQPPNHQPKNQDKEPGKPDPVQVLYDVWRGYHPKARPTPRSADASKLRGRLREDSAADCALVCRWLHEAPDASWWRDNKHLGLTPCFKPGGWSDRLDSARAWDLEPPVVAPPPEPDLSGLSVGELVDLESNHANIQALRRRRKQESL